MVHYGMVTLASASRPTLTMLRHLRDREAARGDTLQRLARGTRVERGRDDPAGLIAAETLRAQRTAVDSVEFGAGRLREAAATAEATLANVSDALLRLRAIAGESANLASPAERAALQLEADAIVEDVDRQLTGAEYRGRKLFHAPPIGAYTPPPAVPTAAARYGFDADTSSFARDGSGNARHGVKSGGTSVPGVEGEALRFDGNDFVDLPTGFMSTASGSVSMYLRTDRHRTDSAHLYYFSPDSYGDGFGSQNEFHISQYLNDDRLLVNLENAGGISDARVLRPGGIDDGQWRHAAATWEAGGELRFYVDGNLIGTDPAEPVVFSDSHVHRLGRPAKMSRYFEGDLDDVRLFDRALSAAEVALVRDDINIPPPPSPPNHPEGGPDARRPGPIGGAERALVQRRGAGPPARRAAAGRPEHRRPGQRPGEAARLGQRRGRDDRRAGQGPPTRPAGSGRRSGRSQRFAAGWGRLPATSPTRPTGRRATRSTRLADAISTIADTDVAEATAEPARLEVLRATQPQVRQALNDQARRVLDLLG